MTHDCRNDLINAGPGAGGDIRDTTHKHISIAILLISVGVAPKIKYVLAYVLRMITCTQESVAGHVRALDVPWTARSERRHCSLVRQQK